MSTTDTCDSARTGRPARFAAVRGRGAPPEGGKRRVEDRNLILAMDEQRAARVIHVVASGEVRRAPARRADPARRPGWTGTPARRRMRPKIEQVVERDATSARAVTRVIARANDRALEQFGAAAAAQRLEIFLGFQDDAERVVDRVGDRASRDRAPRARPPSRWSRTRPAPCTDRRTCSSCAIAVTRSASSTGASGTRSRTMASSFSNDG